MMVDMLADIVLQPTFPTEHIERVRSQKMVHIQERDQDTQQVASLGFYAAMYGDHPYAKSNVGYAETVPSISQQDLIEFHTKRYTPNGTVIVITGDVDTNRVIDLISDSFADWRGPEADQTVPPVDTCIDGQRLYLPLQDKVQSDIVIGCHAISRRHPDFHPVRVANTILGRFGMMGRLGETVREEQGLAYYAYSSLDATPAAGIWLASAGVNPNNVDVAIESILAEFERLGDERVPDTELADSQAYMTGVVPLTLETNEGVASTLLQMEWHDLGLDYLQRYNELIYGVTAEDVQRVANSYLRTDACISVVAGPTTEPNL
jgi:zinc protease